VNNLVGLLSYMVAGKEVDQVNNVNLALQYIVIHTSCTFADVKAMSSTTWVSHDSRCRDEGSYELKREMTHTGVQNLQTLADATYVFSLNSRKHWWAFYQPLTKILDSTANQKHDF
jgi:hypothetical protein